MQKRFLVSVILAALAFYLVAGPAQGDRSESGTMIIESDMTGCCQLDVINNASYDMVAYLCTMRANTVVSEVYIRGRDRFNLTGIKDGSYELYFRQGQG